MPDNADTSSFARTHRIHTIHEPDGSVRFTVIRSLPENFFVVDLQVRYIRTDACPFQIDP